MRIATLTKPNLGKALMLTAAIAAAPFAASAQYSQPVQPYNSQDPQNYSAPAAQAYYGGQQGYAQQQAPAYQQQAPAYDNGYGQGDPNAQYQGQYQDQGQPYSGQEQVYQAPPAIPDYAQPEAPGDGYIWTPGYWAWGRGGYYWVPGQWVLPPYQDALWTPGYWGYGYGGGYFWNAGYWGPVVGYYGGINYGFGYFGTGFYGGYWNNHRFFYNREYAHIGGWSHNFYSQRVGFANAGHPGGQSFSTHVVVNNNNFRGGSYNQGGARFQGNQGVSQQRGFQGSGGYQTGFAGGQRTQAAPQQAYQRPSGTTYGGFGRTQQSAQPQQYRAPQSFQQQGGNFNRPAQQSAPQNFHQSAPQQHFSAPSGGGGFHGGGGGGGSRGGGHR